MFGIKKLSELDILETLIAGVEEEIKEKQAAKAEMNEIIKARAKLDQLREQLKNI